MSDVSDVAKEFTRELPEAFYDGLAYVVPGIVAIAGTLAVSKYAQNMLQIVYGKDSGSLERIILVLFGLCIAYQLGHLLTQLSLYVVYTVLGIFVRVMEKAGVVAIESWYYRRRRKDPQTAPWNPWQKDFDRDWTEDFVWIRYNSPAIGLEITKRYAGLLLSRNDALVCLVLVLVAGIEGSREAIWFFGIFSILLMIGTLAYRCWFLTYLVKIRDGLANAQREKTSSG